MIAVHHWLYKSGDIFFSFAISIELPYFKRFNCYFVSSASLRSSYQTTQRTVETDKNNVFVSFHFNESECLEKLISIVGPSRQSRALIARFHYLFWYICYESITWSDCLLICHMTNKICSETSGLNQESYSILAAFFLSLSTRYQWKQIQTIHCVIIITWFDSFLTIHLFLIFNGDK